MYDNEVAKVDQLIKQIVSCKDTEITRLQNLRKQAIDTLAFVDSINLTDYLLIDSNPCFTREMYLNCLFHIGTFYKMTVETEIQLNDNTLTEHHTSMFYKSLEYFKTIIRVDFENEMALKQICSIYSQLCFYNKDNLEKSLQYLQESLLLYPTNETTHYNLGHIYQKLNKLELSVIHYKIAIKICEMSIESNTKLHVNSLNGVSGIYRSIKQWPEALYFLRKAEMLIPSDPDIQNQLGVVYTEMRRTDLAVIAYKKAIKNYKSAFISQDTDFLLCEIYLNYGHMHSYNGDNMLAIELYNKAIQLKPKFTLPFQNKIMNLTYLFDDLDDKTYIFNQHKLINKIYVKGTFPFNSDYFKCQKINVGIISGDFVDHPVSFFISTFLQQFDSDRFNVTCYSECLINTEIFNKNLRFKFIKNQLARTVSDTIFNDNIHILFDLAGHTAFNRLDVFALKPAPIQISYIGYPYSTGLDEMDYRITDNICDNPNVSQPLYTEKLLFLPNSFLCYDPQGVKKDFVMPDIGTVPFIKNKYITFGCFNRLNKITDKVIKLINTILKSISNSRVIFKTKALLNENVKKQFLLKFTKNVRKRVKIIDCTIRHNEHLLEYNNIDIAIDTFPYSGTTTSCEALMMGVPVFTLYDDTYFFHAQNVTASILKNSNLDFYVVRDSDEIIQKVNELCGKDISFWNTFKKDTRDAFFNGKVCDKKLFMSSFTEMLENIYAKHIK